MSGACLDDADDATRALVTRLLPTARAAFDFQMVDRAFCWLPAADQTDHQLANALCCALRALAGDPATEQTRVAP